MDTLTSLFLNEVKDALGRRVDVNHYLAGKIVGIYFSAHWCPPCRVLTPKIANFYNRHHVEKNFEIIFVSLDDDEVSYKEHSKEMTWLAVEFSEQVLIQNLVKKFNISGIPQLVMLDTAGNVLNEDAVNECTNDENGKRFPWKKSGNILKNKTKK